MLTRVYKFYHPTEAMAIQYTHGVNNLVVHGNNGTNAVTLLHNVKGLIDLGKGLAVGDELVDLELAREVIIYQTGQLGPALYAAEGTSPPDTTSH